jgi:hypothetical protein
LWKPSGDRLFPPVVLADARETGKELLLVYERVGEDHEEATDDAEVTEEEGHVEEEAVADTFEVSVER